MLALISVIIGIIVIGNGIALTTASQLRENPLIYGITFGFIKIYGPILVIIGIMYIIVSVGLWKAGKWALDLQKWFLTYAISVTAIFAANLIAPVHPVQTKSHIIEISVQIMALVYTYVVSRYLATGHIKSYFGIK